MSRGYRRQSLYAGVFVFVMIGLAVILALFVGKNELSGKNKVRYEVIYESSIMGLNIGAPVSLRGVQIGEVSGIKAKLYAGRGDVLNSVYIDIYPDTVVHDDQLNQDRLMEHLVEQGLGAKLKTQSLLTGLLYMEVDFYGDELRTFPVTTNYPQLPTVPTDLETFSEDLEDMNLPELMTDVRSLVAGLNAFVASAEFQRIPASLNTALSDFEKMSIQMGQSMEDIRNEFVPMAKNMNAMSVAIDQQLPETFEKLNQVLDSVESSLKALEHTTAELGDTMASDSPLMYQLQRSSKDISQSARAMRQLAEMLEEQPRSIWSGKKE